MAAVTTIVHFEWIDGTIALKRELEGGMKSIVRAKPPLLVTCQLGLNTPRYPTLPNIMKARKKELTTVELSDLEKADALINTELVYFPEKKGDVMLLEGDTNQMADQLLGILRKKTQALN
jgi:electron transfer flavoprotein beta subunit